MILESLIEDESSVTLDCAQAHMGKGDVIKIDDKHWRSKEVQGAIKLGMIKLIGKPPVLQEIKKHITLEEEETKLFVNISNTKVVFEISTERTDDVGEPIKWTEYAEANGGKLLVPISLINDNQIQNAISWGIIKDPASKAIKGPSAPVNLEELTEEDLKKMSSRPTPVKKRGKSVSNVSDKKSDLNDLFSPSEVIEPNMPKSTGLEDMCSILSEATSGTKKNITSSTKEEIKKEIREDEPDDDDDSGFMDIFGTEPEDNDNDEEVEDNNEEF